MSTDDKNGRMETELERLDGDYLSIGMYRLYLDAYDNASGDIRQATFGIVDDNARHGDNGNSNSNSNDNRQNDDNDNGDGNRDCDDSNDTN